MTKDALWFCSSDVLPSKILGTTREALAEIGFVFRGDHDKNYVSCALPVGWVKKPTGTWHAVIEDPGRNARAYVFLGMNGADPVSVKFLRRFGVVGGMAMDTKRDNSCIIRRCVDDDSAARYLNTRYPEWRNPLVYWEESDG